MRCKCGCRNAAEANFCVECGRPLKKEGSREVNLLAIGAVILTVAIALVLFFRFNTEEKKVIRMIDSIGSVSMQSLEKIEQAEQAFEALDDEEKTLVLNRDILEEARKEYDRQARLIDAAILAIDEIGEITLDSEAPIAAAREALDAAKEYDINNQLSEKEAVLLQAESEYEAFMNACLAEVRKIADVDEVSDEMMAFLSVDLADLVENEQYQEAEALIRPVYPSLTEENVKKNCADVAVTALCRIAKEHYTSGDSARALQILNDCAVYQDDCEDALKERIQACKVIYAGGAEQPSPKNGAILERTHNPGSNTFKITGGDYDACVKMSLIEDPSKYVTVFVKAGEKVTIHLHSGIYNVKFAMGPVWYGEEYLFGPDAIYIELEDTMDLLGYTSGNTFHWTEATYTLPTGLNGELDIQNMNPSDF